MKKNDGIYPFPMFLKRRKLPKTFTLKNSLTIDNENYYYKDSDFEPLMTIWVYNKPFKVVGCDKFTQDYYMIKYNKRFPLNGWEMQNKIEKKNFIIPAYNGFGSEDDIANCISLSPTKKEKNYFKYFENQNTILRFKARLNTSVIEDVDRRFLISFFLCDDTIQIFELTNKNSGIMEGKFLERKKL